MKKIFGLAMAGLGGALLTLFLVFSSFAAALFYSAIPQQYSTTDISNYGQYTGNHDKQQAREWITSFFPEQIEPHFSDVQYSYRAQDNAAYAFEAYLEFTLPDDETYNTFVANHTTGMDGTAFLYVPGYIEYNIANKFTLAYSAYENTESDGQDRGRSCVLTDPR